MSLKLLLGRTARRKFFEGAIWNFCYPNEGNSSPLLMYAIPLSATEECLLDRGPYPSNNDLLMAMLIND